MATYDLTQTTPSEIVDGDILNCPYSGTIISITLPAGVYVLQGWGAKGGNITGEDAVGGKGGYCTGKLTLTEDTMVYLVTGGAGTNTGVSNPAGGYNGGGAGASNGADATKAVGGGGGCSHIATATGILSSLSSNKEAVILVAGGGGGAGSCPNYYSDGGGGGGLTGCSGVSPKVTPPTGGTQSSGGARDGEYGGSGFGQGAYSSDGGGGGGWYGGGPGYYNSSAYTSKRSGAAGGSSYYNTSLLTEYSTIAGNASMPSTSGGTETGHNSSGYLRITCVEVSVSGSVVYANVSGVQKRSSGRYVNVADVWKKIKQVFVKANGEWK